MTLSLVSPKDVPYVWTEVKPLIEKALVYTAGEALVEDILKFILEKDQMLWVGTNDDDEIFCAATTEIIGYPRKNVFRIVTFATKSGHDYEIWKDFIHTIEDCAIVCECTSIEAWVRKGLARKLKWEHEYSVITKNIQEDY